MMPPASAAMPPIVTVDWLDDNGADVVICEVGSSMSGSEPHEQYLHTHIPAARFVSLDDVLASPPTPEGGRHPLPPPQDFARALGALGIDTATRVVAYDRRAGGGFAGRLVWMLRTLDQPAALLDGGLDAWGGPSESGPVHAEPIDCAVRPWPPDAVADADEVAQHILSGGVVIDCRDEARYAGETEPIDAVAGHVPGAVNLAYAHNLDADRRFRTVPELTERFSIASSDATAIVYCGSGVTACHSALAMEHVGLGRPRVFVGSWSAWSADPERPVATGSAP